MQVRGVFDGAAIVFFSYIGFDAVANSAEEVGLQGTAAFLALMPSPL
jgi:amino acid transporter